VRAALPECKVEVLPPDFKGHREAIATVIDARPDVFAHNLETVRRLHKRIRPGFDYDLTLEALRLAKELRPEQVTKSNLILGMGERPEEVAEALRDLREADVDLMTIGQYLQPTRFHLPVDRWVTPEEFAEHTRAGIDMGFAHVEAGPLVRSSYHAGKQLARATA
jgi:lipoic acid synthetase